MRPPHGQWLGFMRRSPNSDPPNSNHRFERIRSVFSDGHQLLKPVHELTTFELGSWPTKLTGVPYKAEPFQAYLFWLYEQITPFLKRFSILQQSSILLIFQGMDASGKDGSIRTLQNHLHIHNLRLARFIQPSTLEAGHDFLWRVHQVTPSLGEMVLFNRSHYEEALVQRVRHGASIHSFKKIVRHIVHFENLLADNGTIVLKFYLNISKQTQYERFTSRFNDPSRRWKLTDLDVQDRQHWDFFIQTYDELISSTSNKFAPWHVIPADDKQVRDVFVALLLLNALESMPSTVT
jgi:polyphosphate kinase 2 (PPK2 family)